MIFVAVSINIGARKDTNGRVRAGRAMDRYNDFGGTIAVYGDFFFVRREIVLKPRKQNTSA